MPENPIRILQVVTQMTRGGLETMLMNYDRHIDHSKVQFDFLEHRDTVTDYDREILELGGQIHRLPRLNPMSPAYLKALDRFFAEHPEYRIVHSHLDCMAGIPLKAAKKNGVPVRIAHAHSSNQVKDAKYPLKLYYKRDIPTYATHLYACGAEAGRWMFNGHPFSVLNNAIDSAAFQYNEKIRRQYRDELGISEHTLLVGHVGRFMQAKNHMFLLDIFHALLKRQPDSMLLLVGQGDLEQAVREKAEELKISDKVVFAGVRDDVHCLYQAMDVFVFPSLFEGLGIVAVEAQAAGLPCVVSDHVPAECKKTRDLVKFFSLEAGADRWAEEILRLAKTQRRDTTAEIRENGYDIQENVEKLQQFYLDHWQV